MKEVFEKFGELLKAERERKNLSIADLAEKLKIAADYLESIEQGIMGEIPSELYFKLFSKSYSEVLGIDYERTMEAIKEDVGITNGVDKKNQKPKSSKTDNRQSDDEDETESASKVNPFTKKLIFIFGGIIIVFVLFVGTNQLFFSDPIIDETGDNSVTAVEEENTPAFDTSALESFDWEKAQYDYPEPIKLRLITKGESWVEVFIDGDTVRHQVLKADRIYSFEASYRILLTVSRPNEVTVELNGKVVDLINTSTKRISKFEINQMNLKSILNPSVPPIAEQGNSQPADVTENEETDSDSIRN